MLNCQSIDSKLISLAEAVYAEIRFEVDMNVSFSEFNRLRLAKRDLEAQFLNYNLYKYQV